MAGERERVDAELAHVEREAPGRLHAIRMQRGAMPVGDRCDLRDVLDDPRFAVRRLHGDEGRLAGALAENRFQPTEIEAAVSVHPDKRGVACRETVTAEHGRVLGRADGEPADVAAVARQHRARP